MNLCTFLSEIGVANAFTDMAWTCPNRVKARDEVDSLMKLNIDFMFLGSKDIAGETIPAVVVREGKTRMTLSSAVPRKTTGDFVTRTVLAFLSEIGCLHGNMIVKSDQEPAVAAIVEDVGRRNAVAGGGRWICENSPVGSSAS